MLDDVTTRRTDLTEKEKEYQQNTLFEKSKNPKARLMRRSKNIDDLVYSSKSLGTVEEGMQQYHHQFKMLMENYKEYVKLLSEDINESEQIWFQAID